MAVAGAATIVLLVAAGRGVPAYRTYTGELAGQVELRTAEVARAKADRQLLEALVDTLDERRRRMFDLAPLFVDIGTPASASGSITSLVSRVAAAAELRVSSIQTTPDTTRPGPVREVVATLQGEGTLNAIVRLLFMVESGTPLLDVREIIMTQPGLDPDDERQESIAVRLKLVGLYLSRSEDDR